MAELTALCMSCRDDNNKATKQVMEAESIEIEEKDGRFSARGKCSKCGGKMFAFLSKEKAEQFK